MDLNLHIFVRPIFPSFFVEIILSEISCCGTECISVARFSKTEQLLSANMADRLKKKLTAI